MQAHADRDFAGALKEKITRNHGQSSKHIVFMITMTMMMMMMKMTFLQNGFLLMIMNMYGY